MWIAPALVLIPIVIRLVAIDYSAYSSGVLAVAALMGVLVGFSEEVLTRGVAVVLLRRAGYNEWIVALVSSLVFALLHSANLLSGQSILQVGPTIAYTFCFGVLMYLSMRVTGTIVTPIVLHALTDPTTMLATGGLDELGAGTSQNLLLDLTGATTVLLMLGGLVLLVFVRGHARRRAAAGEPAHATAEE